MCRTRSRSCSKELSDPLANVRVMSFTERYSRPLPAIEAGGWTIKPYHVTIGHEPIAPAVATAAEELLPKLLPSSLTHPSLVHERSAWVRHVMSPPSPDLAAYEADVLPAGSVGGP